jgi:pSer/pThr/pTyr-binding forkhead associated (FHA) protein
LLVRGGKAFLRDFDSTNGTSVNDNQIKGEVQLRNDDRLKIGPITFVVRIEGTPAVNKPTPPPASAAPAPAPTDDESVAAMLLALQDDAATPPSMLVGPDGIPQGSTVMDVPSPVTDTASEGQPADNPNSKKKEPAKPVETTSQAAKAILEKYTRRQRGQ